MQILNDGLSVITHLTTLDVVVVCGVFAVANGLMLLVMRLTGGR